MPAADYVSSVKSTADDQVTVTLGAFISALATSLGAYVSDEPLMTIIAVLMLATGVWRYILFGALGRAEIAAFDVKSAARWDRRVSIATGAVAALHGIWCFTSYTIGDPFLELTSTSVSIGILISAAGRIFARRLLVLVCTCLIVVPMGFGMLLTGEPRMYAFALVLLPCIISVYRLAGKNLNTLLAALHGREDATRLAGELNLALATMPHGLCLLDQRGNVTLANSRAISFLREGRDNIAGRPFEEILGEAVLNGRLDSTAASQILATMAEGTGSIVVSLGTDSHFNVSITASGGNAVVMIENVTEQINARERMTYLARFDNLTGLPNRASLISELSERTARATDDDAQRSALMLIDVDGLDDLVRQYGQAAGDHVVVQLAQRIQNLTGEQGFAARFSEDQFGMIWCADSDFDTPENCAERLLQDIRGPYFFEGARVLLTGTIGMTPILKGAPAAEKLLQRADFALYEAQQVGSGNWSMFDVRRLSAQALRNGTR